MGEARAAYQDLLHRGHPRQSQPRYDPRLAMLARRRFALALLLIPPTLVPAAASAATWGSFTAGRIAYATGPLEGTVHAELRATITDHGDTLASATPELTNEYLAGIDVFYTAMLRDGTGPSAGALGTLSLDEQAALRDWVAAGGTLIITPDSNGFDGPFPLVYDSWLLDYGVTEFAFVFGPSVGMPAVVHPITEGLGAFALDGTVTFTHGAEGQPLAVTSDSETLMVAFEPGSGFAEGGRMLVLADHNALTDGGLANAGNQLLAQNIVAWAAGECGNTIVESAEECDDGNNEDGDGCDATCALEGAGSSGGLDDTGGAETGTPADTGAPSTTDEAMSSSGSDQTDTTGEPAMDDDASGCSCRSQHSSPGFAALLLLLGAGLRCRRSARGK